MKCAKLQLLDRTKLGPKEPTNDVPRRYCQRQLVNPEYETWTNYDRFYFNENGNFNGSYHSGRYRGAEDLCLSVQNLQFQGEVLDRKRPRTSFKYKTLPSRQHRMFVKELVEDNLNDGRCSELTCYFYDDYAKYLMTLSRPSSGKSSILKLDAIEKPKENVNKKNKVKSKTLKAVKSDSNNKKRIEDLNADKNLEASDKDTRIVYDKSGKRKSLIISRTDSPATLQVIRVDVVCNYSSSSTIADYDDKKQTKSQDITDERIVGKEDSRLANKYLLTNTVKTLDENAGGARVTLLCKTFKLADRSGLFAENKANSLKMKRK